MKKGFIYLGAMIAISLIAVILAATIYVLGTKISPAVMVDKNISILHRFINQWDVLQKQVSASPVLGSTKWYVDDVQFISADTFLDAIEAGQVMGAAVFGYNNGAFNYIAEFSNDFPFTQSRWQEIIAQYGDADYLPQNFTKQIVLNGEVINYDDWTKVIENKFVESVDTTNWQTYRDGQYGFEVKYPENFITLQQYDSQIFIESKFQNIKTEQPAISLIVYQKGSFPNDEFLKSRYKLAPDGSELQLQNRVNFNSAGRPAYKLIYQDGIIGSAYVINEDTVYEFYWNGSRYETVIDQILSTFKFIEPVGQCTQDSDCKLIYSGCSCEAVPNSDPRTYLESDLVCIRNDCTAPTEKAAACINNKCQLKDK